MAVIRGEQRAYQLGLYVQANLPGAQTLVNAAGATQHPSWRVYPAMGLELSLLFGDFTPPRRTPGGDSAP